MEKSKKLFSIVQISWKHLIFPVLGSLLSATLYVIGIKIHFGAVTIRPIHMLIWLIWLIGIEILYNEWKNVILLSVGASFGIVVGYMTNHGSFLASISTVLYMAIAGLASSILFIPKAFLLEKNEKKKRKKALSTTIFWSLLIIFFIFLFRIFNELLRDIPNENRSIMITGIEIHHFVTGMLLFGFALMILHNFEQKKRVVFISQTIQVLGLAMIADQLTYMLIFPLTDEAYFSIFSIIGAVLGVSWMIYRFLYFALKGEVIHD